MKQTQPPTTSATELRTLSSETLVSRSAQWNAFHSQRKLIRSAAHAAVAESVEAARQRMTEAEASLARRIVDGSGGEPVTLPLTYAGDRLLADEPTIAERLHAAIDASDQFIAETEDDWLAMRRQARQEMDLLNAERDRRVDERERERAEQEARERDEATARYRRELEERTAMGG